MTAASRNRRFRLWPGLLVLVLGGCSFNPPLPLSEERLQQLPQRHELTAAPFFPQDDYQCGPAALATLFGHYGRDLTPRQLTPRVFTPDAKGSFPAEMDALARQQGFISYPLKTLEDLLHEISAGHPVLVLQNLGASWYPIWHFAVVVGYDLETRELVLRSGDQERMHTGFALFDATWKSGGRWGRVVLPPQRLPASAQPLPYLKAAADLEQTGPVDAALNAYRTAFQHWPDQPLAGFSLATSLHTSGQYGEARQIFEQLLTRHPAMADGWNNYAYSLQALGCPASARAAARCAAALAPGNANIADSVQALDSPAPDAPGCTALPCP